MFVNNKQNSSVNFLVRAEFLTAHPPDRPPERVNLPGNVNSLSLHPPPPSKQVSIAQYCTFLLDMVRDASKQTGCYNFQMQISNTPIPAKTRRVVLHHRKYVYGIRLVTAQSVQNKWHYLIMVNQLDFRGHFLDSNRKYYVIRILTLYVIYV